MITAKEANGYHFKTGQWQVPGLKMLYLGGLSSGKSENRSRRDPDHKRQFILLEASYHFPAPKRGEIDS